MTRRLLDLLAGLSLLACAAVVALWVRSYRVSDVVYWRVPVRDGTYLVIAAGRGGAGVMATPYPARRDAAVGGADWLHVTRGPSELFAASSYRDHWRAPGVLAAWDTRRRVRAVAVRCWVLALLAVAPPAVRFVPWRRWFLSRRRLARGLCPACGYDLRASTQRCPECGSAVPALQRAMREGGPKGASP
jgi:hypothetical protein